MGKDLAYQNYLWLASSIFIKNEVLWQMGFEDIFKIYVPAHGRAPVQTVPFQRVRA